MAQIVFWLVAGVGLLWLVLFATNLREWARTPVVRLQPARAGEPLPVSVLIPARDEAANIEACLRSLLDQPSGPLEVVVADDRSADDTAAIVRRLAAAEPRLRLVDAGEPPPGWMGKCHALAQAVRHGRPRGEWLLFTDADTLHRPGSLACALADARASGVDLLSLVPHLEARSFWERLLQPTVAALIALFNRPSRINDPARPEVFANGQYILVRRVAYEQIGGHAAVAGRVLEDVELARAVVAGGFRLRLAIGRELFSTRMYTDLRSLVRGWTKNFYMLVQSRLSRVLLAAALSLLLSLVPAAAGAGALLCLAAGWRPLPLAGLLGLVAIWVLVIGLQASLRALNRWYPAYAPLAPLANLVAVFILARSAWLHLAHRGVDWKGRRVFDDRHREEP